MPPVVSGALWVPHAFRREASWRLSYLNRNFEPMSRSETKVRDEISAREMKKEIDARAMVATKHCKVVRV